MMYEGERWIENNQLNSDRNNTWHASRPSCFFSLRFEPKTNMIYRGK